MSTLGVVASLCGGLVPTALILWRHKGLIVLYFIGVALALFVVYAHLASHAVSNAFLFSGIAYLNIGLFSVAKRLGSFRRLPNILRQWFSIEGHKGGDIVPRKEPAPERVYERVPRPLLAGALLLVLSALVALFC